MTGESFNTLDIDNDGDPIIISFWALWCHPCIKELTTIADVYEDWQDETGVKLYAVSIDDARSTAKVGPFSEWKRLGIRSFTRSQWRFQRSHECKHDSTHLCIGWR
jgi:thiol-disulfide isomerase/thioredoxin